MKPIYQLFFCLLLGGAPLLSDAQVLTPGTLAARHFRDGEAAMLQKDYDQAIRLFHRALSAQPTLLAAHKLIAQCHGLKNEYPAAAEHYRHIINADSLFSRTIYFQLADCYYKMGRPEQALHYFEKFAALQELPAETFGLHGVAEAADELILLDRLDGNRRACQLSMDSIKFINITEIQNLGPAINSRYDDYFPFLTNNQEQLYFTRQRENGDEDLYRSEWRNEQWRPGERIRGFNSDQPEGMSTLVRDGRRLYYTACLRENVGGPCDIWEALVQGADIAQNRSLGGPVNTAYWESQAAISCDGQRLYFASNRPGGVGGTDIWMSEKLPNGLWSFPQNLGVPINTPGDEEAPFISNDGQTLYFSSTGHLGLGEQDIFMCWWDERLDHWSVPINLGPPVNGPHRELGFFLSADGRTGYFASNRPGGEGCMDIFYFLLSEKLFGEPITFLEGVVLDSVIRTPIPTLVDINGRDPVLTDDQGRFFLCAGADETLDFAVEMDSYHPYHQAFFVPEWDNRRPYQVELLLRPTLSFLEDIAAKSPQPAPEREEVREHRVNHAILFGFDSAELQSREIERLEALVDDLTDRRIAAVEIIGYADDIGSDAYNLQLSEDRAKHVAVFLLSRNIHVNEVHIQGMGAVAEGDRTQNRRVEIRITIIE